MNASRGGWKSNPQVKSNHKRKLMSAGHTVNHFYSPSFRGCKNVSGWREGYIEVNKNKKTKKPALYKRAFLLWG
jgi:hypothetical protein